MSEPELENARAPSAFAVITIDERQVYTTYEALNSSNPVWEESFDIEVNDFSTIVVRVFDRKCIDRDWPSFIGYTTIHPFTVFPHADYCPPTVGVDEETTLLPSSSSSSKVDTDSIPLVLDGYTMHDMTIGILMSSETEAPINLPGPVPYTPRTQDIRKTTAERRVNLVKFGNRKRGSKKETVTHVYEMTRT